MALPKSKYSAQKLERITLLCMFTVFIVTTIWLLRTGKSKTNVPNDLGNKKLLRRTNMYSNGLTKQNLGFHMRQHGDYWILYNYIVAQEKFKGNESITLVTHGEWTSIKIFTNTLIRWKGPISLTLFSSGTDFQRTRDILNYIKFCSIYQDDFDRFVTLNIIIHRSFVPNLIPRTKNKFYETVSDCSIYEFDYSNNFRILQNLKYPSNLARNVGRLTALTDYVLTVDMEFIPSPNVPQQFMKMIKTQQVMNRNKAVFVLPSVDLKKRTEFPIFPKDFIYLDLRDTEEYINSTCIYKVPNINDFIYARERFPMTAIEYGQRNGTWLGFYISLNMYEPFYDETFDAESKLDKSNHMDLLQSMGYDFYFLKNAFLIRYIDEDYNYDDDLPSLNTTEQLEENQNSVCAYKDILKNFIV